MPKKKTVKFDQLSVMLLVFLFGVFSIILMVRLIKDMGFNLKYSGDKPQTNTYFQKNYSLNIPIITYHYIEVVTDERDFLRKNMAISPAELRKEINELKNQGYEFIFVKQIPKLLSMQTPPTGKYVAITFDDGYRDFYTDAFPVIKETGVKTTVFVVSGFVNYQNYMTEEQLKEIGRNGLIEVGAHTVSHLDLKSVSLEKAKIEVEESKKYLESKLGIGVSSFSYPYGGFNDDLIKIIKNASFTSAVSDIPGITQSVNNLYSLSRIRVGYFFKFE